MWLIATKEFRELLYNPRFLLVFAAAAVLICLSVFNGYVVYKSEIGVAEETEAQFRDELADEQSYRFLTGQAFRIPNKLSIFDLGISGVLNRQAYIFGSSSRQMTDNRYESDPVLATFGELDLAFTVISVLSLFAILFSFNSISGERQAGTLRLLLAGSTRRTSVIIAKFIGGFLPLALVFILPFLVSLAGLLTLTNLRLTTDEWIKLALLALAFLLYLLVFHSLGIAASALSRNSFVSFMLCLLFWVLSVAIIPKGAVNTAAFISPSMNEFEFNRQLLELQRDSYNLFTRALARRFKEQPVKMADMRYKFREYNEAARKEMDEEFDKRQEELQREFVLQRRRLLSTAMSLSRISPASSLTFIAHGITDTGPGMLERFEDELKKYSAALDKYRTEQYEAKKEEEERRREAERYDFVPDANGFIRLDIKEAPRVSLDLSDMPRFECTPLPLTATAQDTLVDLTVLAFYVILFFATAYVAFLRYDVR
jgi:ABC-type transport system involved in multi-copper enzyme maturation permease subunit